MYSIMKILSLCFQYKRLILLEALPFLDKQTKMGKSDVGVKKMWVHFCVRRSRRNFLRRNFFNKHF